MTIFNFVNFVGFHFNVKIIIVVTCEYINLQETVFRFSFDKMFTSIGYIELLQLLKISTINNAIELSIFKLINYKYMH